MGLRNRCTAMVDSSDAGRRCRRPVVPGTDRCDRHGDDGIHRQMHRFYRNRMRESLAKRIDEQLENAPLAAQLDLREELALAREAVGDVVELYSQVKEAQPENVIAAVAAGRQLTDALADLAKLTDSAAKIEDVKQKVVGSFAATMGTVINAVVRAMYESFGNDHRVVDCERRIRAMLEIKTQPGLDGVTSLPGQDVLEMDEMVPSYQTNGEARDENGSVNGAG
jgi:hypothetical protein